MPRMHAEHLAVRDASLPLFDRHTDPRTYAMARRHRDVIVRVGCVPHRNAVLGRHSTPAELTVLQVTGSAF
jgi:uncharacterized protein (DUF924 family)